MADRPRHGDGHVSRQSQRGAGGRPASARWPHVCRQRHAGPRHRHVHDHGAASRRRAWASTRSMVEVKLGDSTLPKAPVSGGSQSSASVLPAIQDATSQLKLKLIDLAINDSASPLHGLQAADCDVKNGRLVSKSQPDKSDSLAELIARNQQSACRGARTSGAQRSQGLR